MPKCHVALFKQAIYLNDIKYYKVITIYIRTARVLQNYQSHQKEEYLSVH